jgi:formate--tetrahydrofolate ligase
MATTPLEHPARALEDTAQELGLSPRDWEPYGWDAAKITRDALRRSGAWGFSAPAPTWGRLVLVTAITPTPQGEGKTTTTIGLGDALRRLGIRTAVVLREPSLGPTLGQKGGGTGGGLAQVVPSHRINLHFTGDLHAVTAANNFLAALVDASLHFGNPHGLDPRRILWHRVLDMDDRALRHVVVGLGGVWGGVPREEEFLISAASEVMAILALARDDQDLRDRLGRVVVGLTSQGTPVTAHHLQAEEAMLALLADALRPNLVRTLEGTPALVHAGPFANLAHGTSSVLAARFALAQAQVVVTEAGFGSDLGLEKFVDLVVPQGGIAPQAVVLVATARALAHHGGQRGTEVPSLEAVRRGLANLDAHLNIVASVGVPTVVAVNRFAGDPEDAVTCILDHCRQRGVPAQVSEAYARGGEGALHLAREVLRALQSLSPTGPRPFYAPGTPVREALEAVAHRVYGARDVVWDRPAWVALRQLEDMGLATLGVCVAKTPYSLTDDPAAGGISQRPWDLRVRQLRIQAGAGFAVAVCGDLLTMPGLPRSPQGLRLRLREDGTVEGV